MTSFTPIPSLAAALVSDFQASGGPVVDYVEMPPGTRLFWADWASRLLPGVLAALVWR